MHFVPQFVGHRLVLLRFSQQHVERRKFGIEAQFGGGGVADALCEQFVDDRFQPIEWQVVSEVKVGQIIADQAQALLP